MKPNDVLPEVRTLLRIALPAAGGQVAFAGLWTVDVLMLGAFGVDALNAASLGRLWLGGTLIFAFGLLLGNDPLIAQAHGAGDRRGLGRGLRRGFVLALMLSIPLAAVWWLTGPALHFLGQDPGLSAAAHRYVAVQIPALPLALAFSALRQYQIARGVVHPSLWVAVAANVVNVAANAVLIFGVFGVPALGAVGAGLATAVTQVFMLVALLLWSRKAFLLETGSIPWGRDALDLPGLRRIVALGWPVALQLGLGTWIFQSITVFAGWLGPTALAAQTVLLSLTGLVFMAPLGLSIAASTRIGHLIGAGDRRQAQRATAVALGTTVVLMAAAAAALTIFGGPLASAFTDDPAVLAAVLTVIPIVAAFQISDGVQAVAGGVLRAMGLTRRAAAVHLGAY
ncbi:MAG: MATE family efflux transporter [Acidobacteriota bacterium]